MSELVLNYKHLEDRLVAHAGRSVSASTVVRRDKQTFRIDSSTSTVESFEIADFSHFVSYHLLAQLFGDEMIRKLSAFQAAAVGSGRDHRRTVTFQAPTSSRRTVVDLLKAA